jgi:hypothetical protein
MRYLYANEPEVARRFASYGVPRNLPERARKVRLSGGTEPPGANRGGWQITPDQRDRNAEHSEDQMRGWQSGSEEQRAQRRARRKRLPYGGTLPRERPRRA